MPEDGDRHSFDPIDETDRMLDGKRIDSTRQGNAPEGMGAAADDLQRLRHELTEIEHPHEHERTTVQAMARELDDAVGPVGAERRTRAWLPWTRRTRLAAAAAAVLLLGTGGVAVAGGLDRAESVLRSLVGGEEPADSFDRELDRLDRRMDERERRAEDRIRSALGPDLGRGLSAWGECVSESAAAERAPGVRFDPVAACGSRPVPPGLGNSGPRGSGPGGDADQPPANAPPGAPGPPANPGSPSGPPAETGPPEGSGPPQGVGPTVVPSPPSGAGPPDNPEPPAGFGPNTSPGAPSGVGPPGGTGRPTEQSLPGAADFKPRSTHETDNQPEKETNDEK